MIPLHDLLVVGGGPIGSTVARKVAATGYDVKLLEQDRCIGAPVQCAGLVSPRVVAMTKTTSIIGRYNEATIHPPRTKEIVIRAPEDRAIVLDRCSFDKEMARKAVRAGTEIILGCRVYDWKPGKVYCINNGVKEVIESKIIVAADGPASLLRRVSGLPKQREYIPGLQAIVGEESSGVEIYIGNDIAPGFFAWSVPHRAGTLYGLGTDDGQAYRHLKALLKSRGVEDKTIGLQAGSIPLGLLNDTVSDGLMLVGDAACQVKPLSGGGLYTGLIAANHCADVSIEALERGDTSKKYLDEYHKRWQDDLRSEISKGMWMRKIYRNFSDKELDRFFDSLRDERILEVIGERGDIDYPSAIAKSVLKTSPKLIKFAGPLIKNLF